MMVVAGKNDPQVPVSESEQIAVAPKKQGTPVWFLIGKDEGHGFRKKTNQDFQFCATVKCLKEFLLKWGADFNTEDAESTEQVGRVMKERKAHRRLNDGSPRE